MAGRKVHGDHHAARILTVVNDATCQISHSQGFINRVGFVSSSRRVRDAVGVEPNHHECVGVDHMMLLNPSNQVLPSTLPTRRRDIPSTCAW